MRSLRAPAEVRRSSTAEGVARLQAQTREVYVDGPIVQYAVALATATRDPERSACRGVKPYIEFGASPRGSINLSTPPARWP